MKIREKERQMWQVIGNSQVRSSDSNSEVMEGAISLKEIGSTSSGKEATRQYFSIVRILATNDCAFEPFEDTQGKKCFNLRYWATFAHLLLGRSLYSIKDVLPM